jgi:hypothetical protein
MIKNNEEKAAALRNAQIAACGSCGFCATYLMGNDQNFGSQCS